MNFDDLNDPDPPRPGMDTLAAVAERASRIRRGRIAIATTAAALAAAIVVVPLALAARGGDGTDDRMASVTLPIAPTTSGSVSTATTVVSTPTVPTSTSTAPPATSTDLAPRGDPTTTSLDPTTTTITSEGAPDVVAIRSDGDAVLITDGSEALVYDGADPRVVPEEGELTIVDSVVVTPDGYGCATRTTPSLGSTTLISDLSQLVVRAQKARWHNHRPASPAR